MEATISLVHALCALVAIFLIWHFCWQPYLLDHFRSRIFALRDRLFDFAVDGHISFSSEGYQATREWLNSILRFAHRFSVLDGIMLKLFLPERGLLARKEERLFKEESDSAREAHAQRILCIIRDRADFEIGRYFTLANPVMWPLFFFGVSTLLLRDALRSFHWRDRGKVSVRTLRYVGRELDPQLDRIEVEEIQRRIESDTELAY